MNASPRTREAGTAASLHHEIDEATSRLRSAYADLVAAVPGGVTSAIDLERALGLTKKLAWQVYRVANAGDPLAAGPFFPGPAATRRVVEAARRASVATPITERIEQATRAFHETAQRHADDRNSFDLMLSAVTGDGIEARNHDLKRAAYRANRQLAGKYCEADVFTLLVCPGDRPNTVHMCSIRGLVNLHRLRPNVGLEIARHRFDRSDGSIQKREAIDADASSASPVALLESFSSAPREAIREVESPDGFVRSLVASEHLGLQSATTCFLADIVRNSPVDGANDPPAIGHIHEVATPTRVLLHDCLFHEDLGADVMPALRVLLSRRDAGMWPGEDQTCLLPVQEAVSRTGRGARAVSVPEVPRYADLIEHVTQRLGWDADRFLLYRARIDFPMLHSVVWMRFDLSDWVTAR